MRNFAPKNTPSFYTGYLQLTENKPLMDILPTGGIELYIGNITALKELGTNVYAPGKWTINQIIQHIIDTERIFINRALRFLRQDKTDLPGYDHNIYVTTARANDRSIEDLLEEFMAVRKSTTHFFKPLTNNELLYTGKANGFEISVGAIGYILIGHPTHHFNIIKEKYLIQ